MGSLVRARVRLLFHDASCVFRTAIVPVRKPAVSWRRYCFFFAREARELCPLTIFVLDTGRVFNRLRVSPPPCFFGYTDVVNFIINIFHYIRFVFANDCRARTTPYFNKKAQASTCQLRPLLCSRTYTDCTFVHVRTHLFLFMPIWPVSDSGR